MSERVDGPFYQAPFTRRGPLLAVFMGGVTVDISLPV